jgi:hypothetical protein
MTNVEFITRTSPGSSECPCGWRDRYAARARHAHWHLAWAVGVAVPASLTWPEEEAIAVVRTTSPVAWRRIAYYLARLGQRENHYDFPSWEPPSGRGQEDRHNTRAFCHRGINYRGDASAVGYLAVADLPTHGRWDFIEPEVPRGPDNRLRPAVTMAWTAFHWRRRGISRALVEAAAQHAGVGVGDLAWCTPFSEAGTELARAYANPDGQGWIA